MKIIGFVSVTVAVFLFTAVVVEKSEQAPPPEQSCSKVAASFAKRQIQGISKCTKSMKFKNGKEKAKKMNCILRCVMIREKLFGEDGQVTADQYNSFVTNSFPLSMQVRLNTTLWSCMEIAFAGFKSPQEDEFCSSYDPFIRCMMTNGQDLCGGT